MGATSSKTQSSVDIANSFVTNVVTNVTNKNKVTTSASQNMEFSCSDAVKVNSDNACSKLISENTSIIMADPSLSVSDKIKLRDSYHPSVCDACTISGNISQESIISITTDDISNNSMANSIQAELSSKINDQLKNTISGTIGAASSKVEALTTIKNYVDTKFDTNIVNESLKQFAFSQTIKSTNMNTTGMITQKLVANVVATNLVTNAIQNDAKLKAAVDKATTAESSTTGAIDSIMSAVKLLGSLWIVLGFIALIVGGFIVVKFKLYCMFPPLASMCAMNSMMGNDGEDNGGDGEDDGEDDDGGEE